jgi:hypothetical protein
MRNETKTLTVEGIDMRVTNPICGNLTQVEHHLECINCEALELELNLTDQSYESVALSIYNGSYAS